MGTVELVRRTGAALDEHLDALARLRIRVFRDYPYLYDGDEEYERRYLDTYRRAPGALVVLAMDGADVVGASTAIPLAHETDEVRAPFEAADIDPATVFYLGESVLLPAYRGRGIGVRFFEHREAHAMELGGFELACFCAVQRPEDHPARPAGHLPLDGFWRRRGYRRRAELETSFGWKDVGEDAESAKPMVFWSKPLGSDPA